jgi:Flp pilus assembly protein TadB
MTEFAGLIAALAVLCTVLGFATHQQRRRYDLRLQTYLAGAAASGPAISLTALPARPRPPRKLLGINQLQLVQAGMTMTARKFLVIQLLLALSGVVLAWIFGRSLGLWLLPVMAGAFVVGVALPRIFVRFKRSRRLSKFESQFASAHD